MTWNLATLLVCRHGYLLPHCFQAVRTSWGWNCSFRPAFSVKRPNEIIKFPKLSIFIADDGQNNFFIVTSRNLSYVSIGIPSRSNREIARAEQTAYQKIIFLVILLKTLSFSWFNDVTFEMHEWICLWLNNSQSNRKLTLEEESQRFLPQHRRNAGVSSQSETTEHLFDSVPIRSRRILAEPRTVLLLRFWRWPELWSRLLLSWINMGMETEATIPFRNVQR